MNFSSLTFIFYFFPISVCLFILINKFNSKVADIFLVVSSYIFYAWTNYYLALALFIFSTIIFFIGRKVKNNKKLLIASLILIVGLLVYFKYADFLVRNFNRFLNLSIKELNIFVPLGISFIIFEAVSYLVDIYRGEEKGTYLNTLLFLSLYSKLISGPIVLWKDFNASKREVNLNNITEGIERIIIGLAKKVIIANQVGSLVNTISMNQYMYGTYISVAWMYMICYAIQIYYDFSGYSDIALGLSLIFGYRFKENFNFPYKSTSVSEFFRRWHISLGTWFKEYIYIPLGGNRKNVYRNLFIVYLITGLWHGTGFTFIIWGIYLGIIVVIERYLFSKDWYNSIPKLIKQIVTLALINFGWLVFSFDSLGIFIKFFKNLFVSSTTAFTFNYLFDARTSLILLIGIIGCFIKEDIMKTKLMNKIKYPVLIIVFVLTFVFIINSSYSPFLYFKF